MRARRVSHTGKEPLGRARMVLIKYVEISMLYTVEGVQKGIVSV